MDNPSSWEIFDSNDGIDIGQRPVFFQHSDGSIYSLTNYSRSRMNIFDGSSWHNESMQSYGGNDIHMSMIETPDGTLWIGGFKLLYTYKENTWHIYRMPLAPIPAVRMDVFYASDGSVWIAGIMNEVFRLDYMTGQWATYNDLNYQC